MLFRKGKQYLLHMRTNTGFLDGQYSVPGGHITGYETPEECVMREAQEELGVHVKTAKFAGTIYRIKKEDGEIRTDFCFLVEQWDGEIINKEPHKHTDPSWFPLEQFPQPMVSYVATSIRNIEKGIFWTVCYE